MKKILLFLLLTGAGVAQQRDTVYINFTPTPLGAAPPSPVFLVNNNVGQTFHTFSVSLGGGTSCINQGFSTSFVGAVESSYDGVNYGQVPQTRVSISDDAGNNTSTKFYRSAGAYPYVRFRVVYFPSLSSNCKVSIFYTGSLSSTPINDATSYNSYSALTITSNACNPVRQYISRADSNINLGVVSIIANNFTSSPINISLFEDPACSLGFFSFVVPANTSGGTFTFPVDPLNSPFIVAVPNSSALLGIYAQSATGGANGLLIIGTTILN